SHVSCGALASTAAADLMTHPAAPSNRQRRTPMQDPSEREPAHPPPASPMTTRRTVLLSSMALALTPSLLSARMSARRLGLLKSSFSDWSLLQALAGSCDKALLASAMPGLTVSSFQAGDTAGEQASMGAALKAFQALTAGNVSSLGPQFIAALIADEATVAAISTRKTDVKTEYHDLLTKAGVSAVEFDAAAGYSNFGTLITTGDGPLGLQGLTSSRASAMVDRIPSYVSNTPNTCAVAVIGAALAGGSIHAMAEGSSTPEVILESGYFGLACIGIAASVLP